METIAKHKKKLVSHYKPSVSAVEIIESALQLARLVLASEQLLIRHRKKVLSEVLWLISEADGKYSTRYRSAEVLRLAREEPTSQMKIQHEHVFPRKKIIEILLRERMELLQDKQRLDQLLIETVGCVVTIEEHKILSNSHEGWNRYAKVPVFDMSTEPPSLKMIEKSLTM